MHGSQSPPSRGQIYNWLLPDHYSKWHSESNLTKHTFEAYESKKATNKKVAQMIKPAKDFLYLQEQLTFNHLQHYVKNLDQRKLETFLRFCTRSTHMCKDKIEVMFNGSCGLGRRPVAHVEQFLTYHVLTALTQNSLHSLIMRLLCNGHSVTELIAMRWSKPV